MSQGLLTEGSYVTVTGIVDGVVEYEISTYLDLDPTEVQDAVDDIQTSCIGIGKGVGMRTSFFGRIRHHVSGLRIRSSSETTAEQKRRSLQRFEFS